MALQEHDLDADRALLARHGQRLLDLARASVLHGFEFGRPLPVDVVAEPAELAAVRSCPVVLRLRSAIGGFDPRRRAGGVRAWRPLLADVAGNAFAAAFADRRHLPLRADDRHDLLVTVMLLGPPVPITPGDAASVGTLGPGRDGVLVEWRGGSMALYPEAWPFCPTPAEFVAEAIRRALAAGLKPGFAPRVYRFPVAAIADGD
jgi:AMMECR1 domain-containing protein